MASTNTSATRAPPRRGAQDKRMSLGTALTYKFNRDLWLKGEYRYDQLQSNAGASYHANVFLVGLKLQR